MKLWGAQRKQSGDTIVEVLIVIAVISSVLASAFLVAQKSAAAVRDSQEHSEMLQILQGQVELVRASAMTATSETDKVFSPTYDYFCMNGSTIVNQPNISTEAELVDLTRYSSAGCSNIQGRYNVAVQYNRSGKKTFSFYGRWESLTGAQGSIQLTYRIQPNL